MVEKSASVHWEGKGKAGHGEISSETGALKSYPFGFASRFEDERRGTNPEEILAAAHAACFTVAFSFACDKAGYATTAVDTQARVRLTKLSDGFAIDRIALTLLAIVPGIDDAKFQELALAAKSRSCLTDHCTHHVLVAVGKRGNDGHYPAGVVKPFGGVPNA